VPAKTVTRRMSAPARSGWRIGIIKRDLDDAEARVGQRGHTRVDVGHTPQDRDEPLDRIRSIAAIKPSSSPMCERP
jgi:hypothetical protein